MTIPSLSQKFPDIYQNNSHYALKSEVKKNLDGRNYSVLTYQEKMSFCWQLTRGFCVFLATLCSLGTAALLSKKIQWIWKAVWTGKGNEVQAYRDILPPNPGRGRVIIEDRPIKVILHDNYREWISGHAPYLLGDLKQDDGSPFEFHPGDYLAAVTLFERQDIDPVFQAKILLPRKELLQLANGKTIRLLYRDQPLELSLYYDTNNSVEKWQIEGLSMWRIKLHENRRYGSCGVQKTAYPHPEFRGARKSEAQLAEDMKRLTALLQLPSSQEHYLFSEASPELKPVDKLDLASLKKCTALDLDILKHCILIDCPGCSKLSLSLIDNVLVVNASRRANDGLALIDLQQFNITTEQIRNAIRNRSVHYLNGVLQINYQLPP